MGVIATCGRPSRGRYVQGCRCAGCTAANNAYWHTREKDKAKERWGAKEPYWADAEPVRKRLVELLDRGFTKRGICRDDGVSRATMRNLLTAHHRTGKPVKRIKAETARKIMEIGERTAFVYYVSDRPAGVFGSLEEFCERTGRSPKYAASMCSPSQKRRKRTYIERVEY